jgi:O-antigen/teichoic acid export membrane protein
MAVLIIGKWSGSPAVGAYSLAIDLAAMATQEVSAPVHRAVFPGYARMASDRSVLLHTVLKVTSVLLLVVLPCGAGISLLAEPVVLILFGTKWIDAIPLVQMLGINGILTVLLSSAHYVNMAVGMTRSSSLVLARIPRSPFR